MAVTETLIARFQPLWAEALQAFLEDPAYAIEMAQVGRLCRSASGAPEILEFSGV